MRSFSPNWHIDNWWPQQESNLHLPLRRGLLYPFNYGAAKPRIVPQVGAVIQRLMVKNPADLPITMTCGLFRRHPASTIKVRMSSHPGFIASSANIADAGTAQLQSRAPKTDDELAIQCVLDTATRSSTGILIYPALWITLTAFTGVASDLPWFTGLNAIGLILLALARLAVTHLMPVLMATRRRLGESLFTHLLQVNAFYWGCLTAASLFWTPVEPMAWVMLVSAVAFCAGGNTLLAINPALRASFPLAMMTPVVLAQLLDPGQRSIMLLALQAIFAVYLVKSSRLVSDDYWAARHAQRVSDQRTRELELASLTDGLTQTPNRTFFERQYAYEWARQCRHGGHVAVLILDLDHFKVINDTHGHPVGDICLQRVARALRQGVHRSCDFVARYGGEEFVILLPETDLDGAADVAERLLESIRQIHLECNGAVISLTASIGFAAMVPSSAHPAKGLVHLADKALYSAKAQGRDRARPGAP